MNKLINLLFITTSFSLSQAAESTHFSKKSVEELARDLANPNTPLTSLKLKVQYREFEGDLPNANHQNSTTLLFQPTLPFPLDNGNTVYFRPGIPLKLNDPVFDADSNDFDNEFGLGDITIDLQYGGINKENGNLWTVGLVSTLPTASDSDLGLDKFTLGPGFQFGNLTKTSVLGAYINHQWDVAGSGDTDVSLSGLQAFAIHLPGGGWNWGSSPIITYNHESDEWNGEAGSKLHGELHHAGGERKTWTSKV